MNRDKSLKNGRNNKRVDKIEETIKQKCAQWRALGVRGRKKRRRGEGGGGRGREEESMRGGGCVNEAIPCYEAKEVKTAVKDAEERRSVPQPNKTNKKQPATDGLLLISFPSSTSKNPARIYGASTRSIYNGEMIPKHLKGSL